MAAKQRVLWRDPSSPSARKLPTGLNPLSYLWFFISLLWSTLGTLIHILNMFLFVRNPMISHGALASTHKILVLGDDFAFGVGDSTNLSVSSGLTQHLISLIRSARTIKHQWRTLNRGVIGSTTADWLPTEFAQGRPTLLDWALKRNEDAEIVIVMLGFNDCRAQALGRPDPIPPATTARNLEILCTHLRALNKHVFLCPINTFADKSVLSDDLAASNVERNRLLREFVGDGGVVRLGPNTDGVGYEFRLREFYAEDGVHFSRKGYVKLAKDFWDDLAPLLVKCEFEVIKRKLGY
ncbi:hypothetical protein HDU96_006366 [Phlyctochytrium bullatum]|nr:hypothetical protein HDU96_006366 [Phlyctochytrium bullatum]